MAVRREEGVFNTLDPLGLSGDEESRVKEQRVTTGETNDSQVKLQTVRQSGVFIIRDKSKVGRGGGRRCRCYERRRAKA